ncbi:hypothetical protein B0H14DRAFT_3467148 [Mycena olivaceomarginata]|nr:hypothetical protein B0H14DRAFT_3467148 [Mycena olivaceomarginata]
MAPSLIAVNLATLAVGSLFYGMYLVLFFISISIFKSTVFVSAILLLVTVTAHWTTIVYRAFVAFVALQHGVDAEAFFNDHTQLTEVIQNGFTALAILIGDSLIIHRLRINLRHFVVIVVESAGLYAFWAIFFAVAYETQSNLQSSVIQTAPALVGIVNALIHTRVGLGWTSEQTEKSSWPSSPLMFADRNAVEE